MKHNCIIKYKNSYRHKYISQKVKSSQLLHSIDQWSIDQMENILWENEKGVCSECGRHSNYIRRYTFNNKHKILCFACWNAHQNNHIINSKEWKDSTSYVFQEEYNLQIACFNQIYQ